MSSDEESNKLECFICDHDDINSLYNCGGCGQCFCRQHSVFPYDDCGIRTSDINYRSCCADCAAVVVSDLEEQMEKLQRAIQEAKE